MDLDQSGQGYQWVKVYLGPSLGWTYARVKPQTNITSAGTYTVVSDDSLILVNIAGLVTVNLPSVAVWFKETAYQPATGFTREIWIKDLGGHAAAFNITVHPFSGDKIDGLAQDFAIAQNRQLLRLIPLLDLTGWISA